MFHLKKANSASLIIAFLLVVSFLASGRIVVKGNQATWVVDASGKGNFSTIQEAINAANPRDTIFVLKGVYYESVNLNKSILLIGEDVDSTILDGNRTGDVIDLTANNTRINGFTIRGSRIYPSYSAIRIEHASNTSVSGNKITLNYCGISLYSSYNNTISDNVISYSSVDGISLYSSINNTISNNTISNNYVDGISFYSSNNNTVTGNTIISNQVNGMILSMYSNHNTIYHNNFDNEQQVWNDATSTCSWSYDQEGNNWNDYVGKDLNEDGIGDNTYLIDANNQDDYPLMGKFTIFDASFNKTTYDITVISNATIAAFRFEYNPETGNKIILLNATATGSAFTFCRIRIPTEMMDRPFTVLTGQEEITPTLLTISNRTYSHLYFTYVDGQQAVRIMSSESLRLYVELLDKFTQLQSDVHSINVTYYDLKSNYTSLLDDYNRLQDNYRELNSSYHEHLLEFNESEQNLRSLTYIFVFAMAVLIAVTGYLSSTRTRRTVTTKAK